MCSSGGEGKKKNHNNALFSCRVCWFCPQQGTRLYQWTFLMWEASPCPQRAAL